jgi:hypothetical protein
MKTTPERGLLRRENWQRRRDWLRGISIERRTTGARKQTEEFRAVFRHKVCVGDAGRIRELPLTLSLSPDFHFLFTPVLRGGEGTKQGFVWVRHPG